MRAEGELLCQLPRDVVVHDLRYTQPRPTPGGLFSLTRRLVQMLWEIRPQAVLATGRIALALARVRPLLPPGTRLLIRECSVLSARIDSDLRHPYCWRWIYRILYRWADAV